MKPTTEGQQHKCDAGVRMEDMSGSTKSTAVAAAVVVLAGVAAILYGFTRHDLPCCIGGLGLIVIGLTVTALITIRRWITDTRQERQLLAAAQREAQGERSKYVAAQAALEVEQGRLRRDLDAERRALTVRLQAEREAMARQFEEARGDMIAETIEATLLMHRAGKFAPTKTATGRLIEFPRQHPERQAERERSREHGGVRP
jgi:hypothetical protein